MKASIIVNVSTATIIIVIAAAYMINRTRHKPVFNKKIAHMETSNTITFADYTNISLVHTDTNDLARLFTVTAGLHHGTNWTREGTIALFREFKADDQFFGEDADRASLLTSLASRAGLDMPTNALGLITLIYSLPLTNDVRDYLVLRLIAEATNEVFASRFLSSYAIFGNLSANTSDEKLKDAYKAKAEVSLSALVHLDSPYASHIINIYDQQRCAEGLAYGPGGTAFSPDRHPEEAKKWLLFYPLPHVREVMAHRWLESDRPETANLLRQYIKQLEAIPAMDPYWGQGWSKEEHPYMKGIVLKRWRNLVGMYERAYVRWLEDGKRKPLHSGLYNDEHWPEYQKSKAIQR